MIIRRMPGGVVRVQAWRCGRNVIGGGRAGMIVYTLSSVLRALDAGYDVQVMAIDRHPDGSRTYHDGVLVLTESDGDVIPAGPIPATPLRTQLPVPGPEMAAERLSSESSPS